MEVLKKLSALCACEKDPYAGGEDAYILSFAFPGGMTTIRIVLGDTSGAQLAITNMTTLPNQETRKGHGTKALTSLLAWALDNKMSDIRAVQVQRQSEDFWTKNGFQAQRNQTNDFRFVENT